MTIPTEKRAEILHDFLKKGGHQITYEQCLEAIDKIDTVSNNPMVYWKEMDISIHKDLKNHLEQIRDKIIEENK